MTTYEGWSLVVSLIAMIGTAAAGYYAGKAIDRSKAAERIAEASLRYQVLLPVVLEYRSAEMHFAIRTLWDFARKHTNNLAEAYQAQLSMDRAQMDQLPAHERLGYLRTTLDYQRRQVSQLYSFLTSVHDDGGFMRKLIYTHWSKSDLQIIPEVLIPMEVALGKAINNPASRTTLDRLKYLYEDSPNT